MPQLNWHNCFERDVKTNPGIVRADNWLEHGLVCMYGVWWACEPLFMMKLYSMYGSPVMGVLLVTVVQFSVVGVMTTDVRHLCLVKLLSAKLQCPVRKNKSFECTESVCFIVPLSATLNCCGGFTVHSLWTSRQIRLTHWKQNLTLLCGRKGPPNH